MKKIKIVLRFLFFLKEINIGFSRGSLGASSRLLNKKNPLTWEFSSFSQNGEDGILDYLISQLKFSDKRFIEIGTSNGLANNTAYFALVKKFSGLMVEGNKLHSKFAGIIYNIFNKGVVSYNSFVTKENIHILFDKISTKNPDIFVLDIDGNDYYLAESILSNGYRPKIFVVEYNSNFGPDLAVTIPYTANFDYSLAHNTRLYYGVSIMAWKKLFYNFGYKFLTVESNGINAIFIMQSDFPLGFLDDMNKVDFLDNKIEMQIFNSPWQERYEFISTMPLCEI